MTELIVPVGASIVRQVTESIRFEIPPTSGVKDNLQKLSSGAALAAAGEVWSKVSKLLEQVATKGWNATQEEIGKMMNFIKERVDELGVEAGALREALLEKLHEAMRRIHDLVLGSIRTRVQIGCDSYILSAIDLQTKLIYSSSVEASLTALCKFVASGETVVTGKYTRLDALTSV